MSNTTLIVDNNTLADLRCAVRLALAVLHTKKMEEAWSALAEPLAGAPPDFNRLARLLAVLRVDPMQTTEFGFLHETANWARAAAQGVVFFKCFQAAVAMGDDPTVSWDTFTQLIKERNDWFVKYYTE